MMLNIAQTKNSLNIFYMNKFMKFRGKTNPIARIYHVFKSSDRTGNRVGTVKDTIYTTMEKLRNYGN